MKIQSLQWKKVNTRDLFWHLCAIAGLVIIAGIAYGIFYKPILHSDDWSVILGRWYSDKINWFDLTEQRPLLMARFKILYGIFGLNLYAFYSVLWLLNLLNVILVYFLLHRLLTRNIAIGFSMAALVLVYPADLTHMWLIMINIRTVVFLILLYAYLLLIYADNGHLVALLGALLCLLLSFGMYEGQLGIAMAWCLLLFVIKLPESRKKRLGLLLPIVLGIFFVLWRTVGYSALQIEYADHGNEELLQYSPLVILGRLLRGYGLMLWAWLDPLTTAFGLAGWQATLLLFIAIAVFIFIGYVISRVFRGLAGQYLTSQQHEDQLRRFMLLVFVGTVFIAGAYFPSIAFFRPTLFQLHTRLNIFPLIGASIVIVALLAVIVSLVSRKQGQINTMVLAGTIPLIILGTMVQAQVEFDDGVSWEEQKQIWNQWFELAPDIKANTHIVLILPENEDQAPSLNRNGQRLPFAGAWDLGTGLKMLYGKSDLSGDLATNESFFTEGVKAYYSDTLTSYDQVVILAYDGTPRQLRIIEDLVAENLIQTTVPEYQPYEHIINVPTTQIQFRWLVSNDTEKQ